MKGRTKNNTKKNNNNSRERALYVALGVCLIFLILIGRLTYIMIYRSKEYKHMAQGQWNSQVTVAADRGDITDRNGSILATSIDVYRVDLDLKAIDIYIKDEENKTTKEEVARKLSEASGVPYDEVMKKLEPVNEEGVRISTTTLVKGIDKEVADRIKDLKIYGVVILY